jgi:hypothetical protein
MVREDEGCWCTGTKGCSDRVMLLDEEEKMGDMQVTYGWHVPAFLQVYTHARIYMPPMPFKARQLAARFPQH